MGDPRTERPGDLAEAVKRLVESARATGPPERAPGEVRQSGAGADDLTSAYDALLEEYRPKARRGEKIPAPRAPTREPPPAHLGKDELVAAFNAVLEHEGTKGQVSSDAERPWRRAIAPIRAGLLAVLSLYVWFGQPTWLWGKPLPPPTYATLAQLQQFLAVTQVTIEEHRQRRGVLPTNLGETGLALPGVTYQIQRDTAYTLTGVVGGRYLVLNQAGPNADPSYRQEPTEVS